MKRMRLVALTCLWLSPILAVATLTAAETAPKDPVAGAIENLKDKNPMVRRQAADQLGTLRDRKAVPGLLVALQDENPHVRYAVVEALGLLRASEAASKIANLMINDKEPQVRQSAALALTYLADASLEDALIQALKDSQMGVRQAAIRVLGSLRSSKALPVLSKLIKDESLEMRRSAASALSQFGSQEAADALTEALKDADASVRSEAIKGIGTFGGPSAKASLQEAFKKDKDIRVKIQAARFLGRMGDNSGAALGLELLKNPDSQRRRDGADILAIVGDKSQALKALNDAIEAEKDSNVKQAMEFSRVQLKARLKIKDEPPPVPKKT